MHSANATRDFCPPDSVKIGLSARLPVRPILPRCALVCPEALYGEESPAAVLRAWPRVFERDCASQWSPGRRQRPLDSAVRPLCGRIESNHTGRRANGRRRVQRLGYRGRRRLAHRRLCAGCSLWSQGACLGALQQSALIAGCAIRCCALWYVARPPSAKPSQAALWLALETRRQWPRPTCRNSVAAARLGIASQQHSGGHALGTLTVTGSYRIACGGSDGHLVLNISSADLLISSVSTWCCAARHDARQCNETCNATCAEAERHSTYGTTYRTNMFCRLAHLWRVST